LMGGKHTHPLHAPVSSCGYTPVCMFVRGWCEGQSHPPTPQRSARAHATQHTHAARMQYKCSTHTHTHTSPAAAAVAWRSMHACMHAHFATCMHSPPSPFCCDPVVVMVACAGRPRSPICEDLRGTRGENGDVSDACGSRSGAFPAAVRPWLRRDHHTAQPTAEPPPPLCSSSSCQLTTP
jgi:hypothetical protein